MKQSDKSEWKKYKQQTKIIKAKSKKNEERKRQGRKEKKAE